MGDTPEIALPHAVALSWGVAEAPQRGPKRELSIERIVDAAMALADEEGLGAVSMSRVATALGYTTMSLYRYVTSKDDLLLLMQDAAADIPFPAEPAEPDWRAQLSQWVDFNLQVFRDHPWILDIPVSGPPMMPNSLRFVDWALRCVRPLPLDDREKMAVVLLVSSYARTVGTIERDIAVAVRNPDAAPAAELDAALRALVTEERYPDLRPLVLNGSYSAGADDDSDDVDWGLSRLLDGIEVAARRASEGGAPDSRLAASRDRNDRRIAALYGEDKGLREAAKARREAESRLRQAAKRERERLEAAIERRDRRADRESKRAGG